jgi:site-specific recombinase XerC
MPNTVRIQTRRLIAFERFLGRSIATATPKDLHAYFDSHSHGPRTVYGILSTLHCFYVWAVEDGHCERDPTIKVPRPRLPRSLPRPARTEQLRVAFCRADPEKRAWLVLGAYMGLRCQEIAGVRREDVLEDERVLRVVRGKGGKERLLPIHPAVLEALLLLPLPREGWVFQRPMGGPYPPWMLSQRFNQWLRECGVEATAHQLRHWFATNLYRSTHDLRLTQEMLGHASPSTTSVYTALDTSHASEAVSALTFDGSDAA